MERGRRLFDLMRTEVMAGQYLDIVAQSLPEPDPEGIATVLRYKSANYSVERPLQIGAALAAARTAPSARFPTSAFPVGEAFQLRDDLLGVFGDPQVTGKPSGDDLREGKRTMLVAHAFANGDDGQRALLTEGLGAADLDAAAWRRYRRSCCETGAVAASRAAHRAAAHGRPEGPAGPAPGSADAGGPAHPGRRRDRSRPVRCRLAGPGEPTTSSWSAPDWRGSCALRLAGAGRSVTVLEREPIPGGRAGLIEDGGYRFDTGPTVLTMPGLIAMRFAAVGEEMADGCTSIRSIPIYRAYFPDGSTWTSTPIRSDGGRDRLGHRSVERPAGYLALRRVRRAPCTGSNGRLRRPQLRFAAGPAHRATWFGWPRSAASAG